ncbi:MAG TPA: PorP/SprF family type IX secretion system membrane protein [Flavisolibacter sp.]
MKKHTRYVVATFCALQVTTIVLAQDLHFSQFFNSPLTTNPANTGFIPDGDYRLGVNYRNQWSSVMSVPYKTMSAFGDIQVFKDKLENGWLGLGGVVLRDVAGSGNLTSTKVYGSVAYHQMLGFSSLLSLGFNAGYANKQINVTNLKFPDQFDGKFFDNKMPTAVMLDRTNIGYADIQAGLNYAYFPTGNIYVNTGFSVHHVNKPHESFFTSSEASNRVPRRYIGFLNGSFKLNENVIVNPNIYYTQQAKASELVGGVNAHYNLSGNGDYVLVGGLYYRHKESVIPLVGLGVKDYTFSFTYDVTISSMRNYNGSRGAFEFSLIRQGLLDHARGNVRQVICPTFRN